METEPVISLASLQEPRVTHSGWPRLRSERDAAAWKYEARAAHGAHHIAQPVLKPA